MTTADAIPARPKPVVIMVPTSDTKPMEDNYRQSRTERSLLEDREHAAGDADIRNAKLKLFIRSLFLRSLFTLLPR